MKLFLPVFTLFVLTLTAKAQQPVIIKDSSVKSVNGSAFSLNNIFLHSYNNRCQDTLAASSTSRTFYAYYDDGRLYKQTIQFYISNSFTNYSQFVYTYNDAGKTTGTVTEFWDASAGVFTNTYKDSNLYDAGNYLLKNFFQSWNDSSGSWVTAKETDYYNNGSGRPDSSITNTYSQYNYALKNYYSHYDSANVRYQVITNYTDSTGTLYNRTRTTYYRDSANAIARDSTVYDNNGGNGSFIFLQYDVVRKNYDGGNLLSEADYITVSTSYRSTIKIFYTYGDCNSVLPVAFLNTTAQKQNKDVVIRWQTAAGNASRFSVQRSTDGIHYTTIGTVAASGNDNYMYTDVNAFATTSSTLYYRISVTSEEGKSQYSNTMMLAATSDAPLITISPNPAVNTIQVFSLVNINNAFITIKDVKGNTVYTLKQNLNARSSLPIRISALAKGMYIVTIRSASYQGQVKMIKE